MIAPRRIHLAFIIFMCLRFYLMILFNFVWNDNQLQIPENYLIVPFWNCVNTVWGFLYMSILVRPAEHVAFRCVYINNVRNSLQCVISSLSNGKILWHYDAHQIPSRSSAVSTFLYYSRYNHSGAQTVCFVLCHRDWQCRFACWFPLPSSTLLIYSRSHSLYYVLVAYHWSFVRLFSFFFSRLVSSGV